MKDFITNKTKRLFERNHINGFSSLWKANWERVDEPNHRGEGYSEVVYGELRGRKKQKAFFVKRQFHYYSRTLRHPIKGVPLIRKEFYNIKRSERLGVPVPKAVYYAERNGAAILVLRNLDGMLPLDQWLSKYHHDKELFQQALPAVAKAIAHMHNYQLQHGALYPKHIFISTELPLSVCFIDMEGMKKRASRYDFRVKDLASLYRHLGKGLLSSMDQMLFLDSYLKFSKKPIDRTKLCRLIDERIRYKSSS